MSDHPIFERSGLIDRHIAIELIRRATPDFEVSLGVHVPRSIILMSALCMGNQVIRNSAHKGRRKLKQLRLNL